MGAKSARFFRNVACGGVLPGGGARKKHKLGIIGCGMICQTGHIPTILNNDYWTVHALFDPNPANLAAAQKISRAPNASTDWDAFFRSGVEAVSICSSAPCHFQNVMDACERGVPILCEKPLATNENEAARMIAAAKAQGVPLFTAFDYRFSVAAMQIRDLIRAGAIGEPRALRLIYVWNNHGKYVLDAKGKKIPNPHRVGRMNEGGPLVDCGVHQIDLARWWLGSEVDRWSVGGAWVDNFDAPDHVWLQMDHRNGAHTAVEISYSFGHVVKEPVSHFVYHIVGTGGLIRYSREERLFELRTPEGTQPLQWSEEKNFGWMYDAFAKALETGEPGDVLASAEDGMIATKIAREATEKVMRYHRRESADLVGGMRAERGESMKSIVDGPVETRTMHHKPATNGMNGVIDGPMRLLTDGRPAIEGFDY